MTKASGSADQIELIGARLRLNRAVFDWCGRNAERELAAGNPEKSVRWALVAAQCADTFGCGVLASPSLESLLLRLAAQLQQPAPTLDARRDRPHWLHVFSKVYRIGGHTALATRWIENDATGVRHSIVLTSESKLSVPALAAAIALSGGACTTMDTIPSIGERGERLRELAWRQADVVVLHTHMWDVIPTLAFGVPGGPPVMLVNHADHAFWLGASVADLVVNIRASGLLYSRQYRGVDRNLELPLPLVTPPPAGDASVRTELRRALKVPVEAPLLLTIGTEYKFEALGPIDFLDAARRILQQHPSAYLVAVGPDGKQPRWTRLQKETQGRLICAGVRHDLPALHAAADLYLEGFPFGSLTALLGAALAGLPCVRAPALCPPPFVADGAALDGLEQPKDLDAYVRRVLALLDDPEARQRLGTETKRKVESIHCGEPWLRSLAAVKREIPSAHNTYSLAGARPLPPDIEAYWGMFAARWHRTDPVQYAVDYAAALGLQPCLDHRVFREPAELDD